MKDTTLTKAFQIIDKNDTVTYTVDKEIIDHFVKNKATDFSHYFEILIPVAVALITITLTKLLDIWAENKKNKRAILKKNRKMKIHYLEYLNTLKTSFGKSHFPNADYDDFLNWIADKMVGTNPFEDLKINSNIIFNSNNELIELIDELFNKADTINNNFDWPNKEHPNESLRIAGKIYDELGDVIDKISKKLN